MKKRSEECIVNFATGVPPAPACRAWNESFTEQTMSTQRPLNRVLLAVATAVLTFLVYLPSLNGAFLNFDDWLYCEDTHVTAFSLVKAFTDTVASNWHPLTVISYAIDYRLWGLNPWWFHLENNIIHSLNVLLVFFLASRLFGPGPALGRKTLASAFVALLFGLHPLHVESVAWIAERKDVLCGFFFISSLLAYASYAGARPGGRAFKYFSSLVLFALALMSKPMAVSLPFVLLIADFHPLGRLKSIGNLKKVLPEKAPFFLLSAASGLLTLWAQRAGGAVAPLRAYPLGWRVWFSARTIVFYLYKTIIPAGLSPYYPIDVSGGYFGLGGVASILIILAVTVFALVMLSRTRAVVAAWAYFIVTILPVAGIIAVGGQAAADRYTYLPSIGLFLLAGAGLLAAVDARSRLAVPLLALSLVILAAFSAVTVRQQAYWKDSVALWSREIETFPGFYLGYDYRGSAWAEAGKYSKAIEDYDASIRLKPTAAETYVNRGMSYLRLNENEKAKEDFVSAIRLDAKFAVAYHQLSIALKNLGEDGYAAEAERKARELGYR